MPHYRLYVMNARTGHIDRFEELEASSDEAARIIARGKLDGHPLELWEGHRKVERLEPEASGAHVLKVWQQRSGAGPNSA